MGSSVLRVNEVFSTIQGEANWAGTPSTFIRLQGCPVGCSWCDTKHTWPEGLDKKKISTEEMLLKEKDAPTFAEMTAEQIVYEATKFKPRHFVITGGEPCYQDIYKLTKELKSIGTVQVETSGTYEIDVAHGTWVTVSPKVNMAGGFKVLPDSLLRANEIKMPVVDQVDVDNLKDLIRSTNQEMAQVWLQPVSQKEESTQMCLDTCMQNNWRISIQTHKYMGVR